MKKLLAIAFLPALVACTTVPLSNQIEASSKTIQDLATQVGRLQQAGTISNEREDAILDELARANQALRQVNILAAACKPNCADVQNQLLAINQLLIKLQSEVNP